MTTKKVETNAEGAITGRIIFAYDDHVVAKAATDKEPAMEGHDSFDVFDIRQVPGFVEGADVASTFVRLAVHGASQRVGDSYAGAVKDAKELGLSVLDYTKQTVRDSIDQLYKGTWRVNAGGGPRVNDLAMAIARVTGEPLEGEEGTVAYVGAMTDEDKKVERKKPAIAAALASIAAEKAVERANRLIAAAKEAADKEAAEKATATA